MQQPIYNQKLIQMIQDVTESQFEHVDDVTFEKSGGHIIAVFNYVLNHQSYHARIDLNKYTASKKLRDLKRILTKITTIMKEGQKNVSNY